MASIEDSRFFVPVHRRVPGRLWLRRSAAFILLERIGPDLLEGGCRFPFPAQDPEQEAGDDEDAADDDGDSGVAEEPRDEQDEAQRRSDGEEQKQDATADIFRGAQFGVPLGQTTGGLLFHGLTLKSGGDKINRPMAVLRTARADRPGGGSCVGDGFWSVVEVEAKDRRRSCREAWIAANGSDFDGEACRRADSSRQEVVVNMPFPVIELSLAAARNVVRSSGLLVAVVLAGCVHAPLNQPLSHGDPESGYHCLSRIRQLPQDDVAVMLFFSGGGMRAAALSYGVMEELARTPRTGGGRLLDSVKAISAVSGGCFPAAYYCLYGYRLFSDFENGFLKRDVQGELGRFTFSLRNEFRLASAYFARSDAAAEYYDRILFHGACFGDLMKRPSSPMLMINATDMDVFAQFPFTQDMFDLIGSDLSNYPIARAVAASSAVPGLLTPITLKNYSGKNLQPATSLFLSPDAADRPNHRLQKFIADTACTYLDAERRPYIHLLDGGLVDNLGVGDLLTAMTAAGGWEPLLRQRGLRVPSHLVMIVVSAATEPPSYTEKNEKTPRLPSVVGALSKNALNRTNRLMMEVLRESLDAWQQDGGKEVGRRAQIHLVTVNFEQIKNPAERVFFDEIPTRLTLPPKTVDRLVAIGARLLRESQDYQALLAEINQPGAEASGPAENR